ncbi:hemolymph lipopolysaccharide-binding protein [Anabrus simplex]|uniref:hemolymph lipopolysaccharide-binding protein n=1 Tax=Anabrus simplex TaxID=316456 RepID=UPI0035A26623
MRHHEQQSFGSSMPIVSIKFLDVHYFSESLLEILVPGHFEAFFEKHYSFAHFPSFTYSIPSSRERTTSDDTPLSPLSPSYHGSKQDTTHRYCIRSRTENSGTDPTPKTVESKDGYPDWGVAMLLLLVLSAMILESPTVSGQSERSPSSKFSVSSSRNESGHRLVAVELKSQEKMKDGVSLRAEMFTDDSRSLILRRLRSSGLPEEQPPVTTTVAPTVVPLPGYHHFPGFGYYKILPKEMTWRDGVEACRKEGAHMVVLETQEEIDIVYQWARCCPWVGVHRESSSGPWMNVLGQTMNSTDFFGWLRGFPESGEYNCLLFNAYESFNEKGTSNDSCDDTRKVICEQTL